MSDGTHTVPVHVYDPVLTEADRAVIEAIGGSILSADEAMQHTCSEEVLFYMPHCDASLYNEVLDSNWGAAEISRLSFLGNSFRHMEVCSQLDAGYLRCAAPAACRSLSMANAETQVLRCPLV